jgi:S-adenosylmethionine/arginine decarboxylase-like enzyme
MMRTVTGSSCITPLAEVRTTRHTGRGLFAREYIAKDTVVAVRGGKIYSALERNDAPEALRSYMLQIDGDLFIGPESLDAVSEAELVNHSCNPNLGFRGQIMLVAMRDIMPGEELTIDYAMAEAREQNFICQCGSHNCRGIVRETDYLLPELQKRYDGYFSPYIARKMDLKPEDLAKSLAFEETGAWGLVTALDLWDCDPHIMRNRDAIYAYTVELCRRIGVSRFGEPIIVHFGADERVAGYSLVQLIETSLVSGHFANLTNRIYLDIFSCAHYDPTEVIQFSKDFFKAGGHNAKVYLRH